MKSFRDNAQLLAGMGVCHLIATILINLVAAGWYLCKYEHIVIQGKDVHLPWMLVVLEYSGKSFMLPLVPLVYAW